MTKTVILSSTVLTALAFLDDNGGKPACRIRVLQHDKVIATDWIDAGSGKLAKQDPALPKDEEVANAMAFHESDFAGAFKNPGTLPNSRVGAPTTAVPRGEESSFDRPIKPTLIATARDAQLKAALDHFRNGVRKQETQQPG